MPWESVATIWNSISVFRLGTEIVLFGLCLGFAGAMNKSRLGFLLTLFMLCILAGVLGLGNLTLFIGIVILLSGLAPSLFQLAGFEIKWEDRKT